VQKTHETEYVDYVNARLPWLRRTAYVMCQDWHAADEVTQRTITRVYDQWSRVRAADNIDGYVRTILVRVFLAERRSRWHRVRLGHDPSTSAEPVLPEHDHAGALDLNSAIANLPARQRATLVLRFYCDLTIEETAAALGVNVGTVKSQTAKAIGSLRRTLGAAGEPTVRGGAAGEPTVRGGAAGEPTVRGGADARIIDHGVQR
jgi:RNA polymerase sigma-70 factor (sigma-E family)